MTEMVKSVLFVAAAAFSLLIAFSINPSGDVQNLDELVGVRLNQFEVEVAKRLKIVKFDQETASTREFEVAENDGLWSIPSKQDYPADAAKQMAEAATCVIDREVLRIAGKSANDHEALGVIDPGTSKLDSKAEGVGLRVTITDANDEALADMIIGKSVKDAEGQYYVRNADQDVVYVVNLDPDKLSTKFEDWIEDDLLKLNPMDIYRVNIKDYSAELQPMLTAAGIQMQVRWDRRGEITLNYDQEESKWQPELLQEYDPEAKEMAPYELAADEELSEDNLRELRNGLDDLLLVDVERKPSGLSADLKAGSDFLKDNEAASSLIGRGFAPLSVTPDAPPEILSTEGEIICTLKDGVEYVLRFGNLQIGEEGEASDGKPASDETADSQDEAASDDGINRYLFVMARFNESMIEQPELAELPELPETANEEEQEGENSEAETETDDEAETDDEPKEPGESASADGEPNSEPAKEESTEEESTEEEDLASLIAERESLEKENQRKLEEYQEQLKAGQERVTELNERFGDWYYVISNDVYKKIHLGREEVIAKKESEAAGAAAEAGSPAGGIPGLPNLPIGGGATQ